MNQRRPLVAIALPLFLSTGALAAIAIAACATSASTEAFDPGDDAGTPAPGHDGGQGTGPDGGPTPLEAGSGADAGPDSAAPDVDASWTGRPPAAPLFVRTPYLSTWSTADSPNGVWPTFWNGAVKAMTAIARIDGASYLLMGAPTNIGTVSSMTLVARTMTPTKTVMVLGASGVEVTLDFLSPVEPADLKRQSAPIAYVSASARSSDGASHAVHLYFDISGEWAHGDAKAQITWARESVPRAAGTLTVQSFTPSAPQSLVEVNEYPAWGTAFLAADIPTGMTVAIGEDAVVRKLAVSSGVLDGTVDTRKPRAINDAWPVLGYAFDLGSVSAASSTPVMLVVGHAREPAVSYKGTPMPPLWRAYWPTWQAMVADAYDDFPGAVARAAKLDSRIVADATAAGGSNYAALCTLSLRQAFGGTELVGTAAKPWMMLKEISSDGNVSTVDVIYPASPVFLYTNPLLLKLLLDPLLEYAEHGGWPKKFAEHDVGSSYPNATGHDDGNEEDMPIEESADMLLMMAGYVERASAADAQTYATAHYAIAKQWADYLVPNTLDPVNQNQTDDFTGFINHSANLALKGILGVGAMAVLARAAGNTADATSYGTQAQTLIGQWATRAQDDAGAHLLLEYDQPGTWSLKYNAFYDRVLKLGLVPAAVLAQESAWYAAKANQVGVPLDPRHTYTKTDWELWTAASIDDVAVRAKLIDAVYDFATTSTARVPFSDWYDTVTGQQQGFMARPVVGGLFTLVALKGTPIVAQ